MFYTICGAVFKRLWIITDAVCYHNWDNPLYGNKKDSTAPRGGGGGQYHIMLLAARRQNWQHCSTVCTWPSNGAYGCCSPEGNAMAESFLESSLFLQDETKTKKTSIQFTASTNTGIFVLFPFLSRYPLFATGTSDEILYQNFLTFLTLCSLPNLPSFTVWIRDGLTDISCYVRGW